MPADTINVLLDLDVPVTLVEALVKQHLQTLFTPNGHSQVTRNGQAPHPQETETAAPVLDGSTGAP